jgi:hypothetical protein
MCMCVSSFSGSEFLSELNVNFLHLVDKYRLRNMLANKMLTTCYGGNQLPIRWLHEHNFTHDAQTHTDTHNNMSIEPEMVKV